MCRWLIPIKYCKWCTVEISGNTAAMSMCFFFPTRNRFWCQFTSTFSWGLGIHGHLRHDVIPVSFWFAFIDYVLTNKDIRQMKQKANTTQDTQKMLIGITQRPQLKVRGGSCSWRWTRGACPRSHMALVKVNTLSCNLPIYSKSKPS